MHYLHFYLYCDLIKSDGIQEGGGLVLRISAKSLGGTMVFRTFFNNFDSVMFGSLCRPAFRPLVFHLKIKYSRGGISWLISPRETPKRQLSLMFFKLRFQPPQPAVSTAKPQQHTNSISTQFLEGLMCPCLATTSPSKPLSAYRVIFLQIISSAFLKVHFQMV